MFNPNERIDLLLVCSSGNEEWNLALLHVQNVVFYAYMYDKCRMQFYF